MSTQAFREDRSKNGRVAGSLWDEALDMVTSSDKDWAEIFVLVLSFKLFLFNSVNFS